MKYMGSKAKIAKHILPIILKDREENQYYVEPFVGGCNSIDKVTGLRIGADNNPFLIAMWEALQQGFIPPQEVSKDTYKIYRNRYNTGDYDQDELHLIGYIGFNSFGGRFYEGGYANTINSNGVTRNYSLELYNSITKQVPKLIGIEFTHSDYKNLIIPPKSIIYCDPPYLNTKHYSTSKGFNHEEFYDWCRTKKQEGHTVFVSEYSMPNDFTCVWQKEVCSPLTRKKAVEKLFRL